ncbi:MAG: arginine--tRNA ligase [Patescibacteria group bacterium]|nr:arginine--tRNA ligase [Patescibacteria group bacterium]
MKTLKSQIQEIVELAYQKDFGSTSKPASIEYCDIKFGHFATNIALANSKELGVSPAQISRVLAKSLASNDIFESVEVQEPGFINMRLKPQLLLEVMQESHDNVLGGLTDLAQGEKMVIDYSHPNIGKPMGVHHLLSTVIGDSIKRLYRKAGYQVIADNFIGDMGTQFGKLIHAVKTWGDMEKIENNPVPELLKLYVRFHIEAETDEELDESGRAEYKKLEEGDAENRALLKKIQTWSMAEILALYDELDVEFDHFNGESFYEDKIAAVVQLGKEKGIFTISQGALVCHTDNPDEPPAIILKKDGTSLYLTKDLARIAYWQKTWSPDYMVNVVDIAQSLHLKQVYEVAAKLNLTKASNIHVAFGRMQFAQGSMSTRKGNIILIEDLLVETKNRVRKQIVELSKDLTPDESSNLVDILAINSLKYNILRQNRLSNISFDWDNMLSLEGNSAPYLAYSAVRMQAIARLSEEKATLPAINTTSLDTVEVELILQISRATEVFASAASGFDPSNIANYCYELCRMYNSFYHTHRVVEEDVVLSHRLLINNTTLRVLEVCFEVLGLKLPAKM